MAALGARPLLDSLAFRNSGCRWFLLGRSAQWSGAKEIPKQITFAATRPYRG